VDPVSWPYNGNQALFDVNLWLDPYGKFISRARLSGVMWIVEKEPRLLTSHDIHEILFSLLDQDCQKLERKCDTIPLLGKVNRVWNPSEMAFFQSQVFATNLQARGNVTLRRRAMSLHDKNGRSSSIAEIPEAESLFRACQTSGRPRGWFSRPGNEQTICLLLGE
jgi:hypothetical protein